MVFQFQSRPLNLPELLQVSGQHHRANQGMQLQKRRQNFMEFLQQANFDQAQKRIDNQAKQFDQTMRYNADQLTGVQRRFDQSHGLGVRNADLREQELAYRQQQNALALAQEQAREQAQAQAMQGLQQRMAPVLQNQVTQGAISPDYAAYVGQLALVDPAAAEKMVGDIVNKSGQFDFVNTRQGNYVVNKQTGEYTPVAGSDTASYEDMRQISYKQPQDTVFGQIAQSAGPGNFLQHSISPVVGMMGGEIDRDTVKAINQLALLESDVIRTISLNPRFPVAEMQRVAKLSTKPGLITSADTMYEKTLALKNYIEGRLEESLKLLETGELTSSQQADEQKTVAEFRRVLGDIGLPEYAPDIARSNRFGQAADNTVNQRRLQRRQNLAPSTADLSQMSDDELLRMMQGQ